MICTSMQIKRYGHWLGVRRQKGWKNNEVPNIWGVEDLSIKLRERMSKKLRYVKRAQEMLTDVGENEEWWM